jgi:putative spermidine/putrescine transport system permease protein
VMWRLGPRRLSSIIAWVGLGIILLPLILTAIISVNPLPNLVFPPHGFSLHWYLNIFSTAQFGIGLAYSAFLAATSTAIGLAAGICASYAIVRFRFPGRALFNSIVMSPLIVPEVVIGIGLLILFTSILGGVGVASLIFLHSLMVLPYVVRVIVANLQTTDNNLEDAARLLGAPPIKAFLLVTLPSIRKGVVTAIVFCLTISFHNFTATVFLITTVPTLPAAVYGYIATEGDPTVAALSTLVTALAFVLVWIIDRSLGLRRFAK